MKDKTPLINNDWDIILKDESQKKSFKKLIQLITTERKKYTVFPSKDNVFNAFASIFLFASCVL